MFIPAAWFQAGTTETENWMGAIKYMTPWDVEWKTYAAVGDLNSFFGFHRITDWGNEFYRGRHATASGEDRRGDAPELLGAKSDCRPGNRNGTCSNQIGIITAITPFGMGWK